MTSAVRSLAMEAPSGSSSLSSSFGTVNAKRSQPLHPETASNRMDGSRTGVSRRRLPGPAPQEYSEFRPLHLRGAVEPYTAMGAVHETQGCLGSLLASWACSWLGAELYQDAPTRARALQGGPRDLANRFSEGAPGRCQSKFSTQPL